MQPLIYWQIPHIGRILARVQYTFHYWWLHITCKYLVIVQSWVCFKSSWLCFTILEHGQLKNVKRLPTSASLLSHSSSSVVEVLETRRKFLGASISEKNDKADNVGDTETHSQRLWTSKQQTQVTLNCQLLIFSSSCSSNTFLFVFL